jgi:hypothetical protein
MVAQADRTSRIWYTNWKMRELQERMARMTITYPPLEKSLQPGIVYVNPVIYASVERICKNCRFWSTPSERMSKGGDCSNPKFLNAWRDGSYNWTDDAILMQLEDDFVTGPEFGCVHFAEKDVPEGEAKKGSRCAACGSSFSKMSPENILTCISCGSTKREITV